MYTIIFSGRCPISDMLHVGYHLRDKVQSLFFTFQHAPCAPAFDCIRNIRQSLLFAQIGRLLWWGWQASLDHTTCVLWPGAWDMNAPIDCSTWLSWHGSPPFEPCTISDGQEDMWSMSNSKTSTRQSWKSIFEVKTICYSSYRGIQGDFRLCCNTHFSHKQLAHSVVPGWHIFSIEDDNNYHICTSTLLNWKSKDSTESFSLSCEVWVLCMPPTCEKLKPGREGWKSWRLRLRSRAQQI